MTSHPDLETRPLGRSSVEIPVLGFGSAPLGELFEVLPEALAQEVIATAWDSGIRYFDTAPWYGHGLSEHRLGHFLRQQPRDAFLLSTKVGRVYRRAASEKHLTAPWVGGLPFELRFDYRYDGILRSFEDSLQRLGLQRIDFLVIHDLDAGYHGDALSEQQRDLEESGWRALDRLRSENAIQSIGAGINDETMIPYFLNAFDLDFLLVAMPYTLLDQGPLTDLFPACSKKGVAVVVGAPFASGILATGPVDGAIYNYAPASDEMLARTCKIDDVCRAHGVTLQAAALQFPLGHELVRSVIPGANRPGQVTANVANLRATIPDAFWSDLKAQHLLVPDAPVPG